MNEQRLPAGASAGRAPNTRPLNEMLRADGDRSAPSRTVPEAIAKHYTLDGNAYKSAYKQGKIEFVDRGNRMHAYQPVSTFTVRSMVEIAEARGWKSLELTGTDKFKQSAHIEATSRGIATKGYEATPKDAEILQRREERKSAEQNPMVRAFLEADSAKARSTAAKNHPALTEAFKLDAAVKAYAEQKIDSKKAAESFVGRFRDSVAIALHTGRELPKVNLAQEQSASASDQGKSR